MFEVICVRKKVLEEGLIHKVESEKIRKQETRMMMELLREEVLGLDERTSAKRWPVLAKTRNVIERASVLNGDLAPVLWYPRSASEQVSVLK